MTDLDRVRFQHNPQNEILLKALEHVRHFIISKQLVLVGGMAIDCNLRLRGRKLYDDDEIPDYDVNSPEVTHAYTLGGELCEMGFPAVDVIPAVHATTMRVRVDGNVVADITYMPATLFGKLRTLEYQGMRIMHPWYIMMDQFRSLSMPYENPPNEVIFARWDKDVKRLNMLLEAYPLDTDTVVKLPASQLVEVPLGHGILQGWAALAWHEHRAGISGLGWKENGDRGTVSLPVSYVTIMTTEPEWWRSRMDGQPKLFNATYSYPRYMRTAKFEVYDTWGERITCEDAPVASLTAIMYYFLHAWLLRGDPVALAGVRRTITLLSRDATLRTAVYGDRSWNVSTLCGIANIIDRERVKNWKPQTQSFERGCEVHRQFDARSSPLFAIDGAECSEWVVIVPPERLEIH